MNRLALCDVDGPLKDLLEKLSGKQGVVWLQRLKMMLRGEEVGKFNPLLKFIATRIVNVGGVFSVEKACVVSNVGKMNKLFERSFFHLTWPSYPSAEVSLYDLSAECTSIQVSENAQYQVDWRGLVAIPHIFDLVQAQAHGEDKGILLANGHKNIFFTMLNPDDVFTSPTCIVTAEYVTSQEHWKLSAQDMCENSRWSQYSRVFLGHRQQ